MSTIANAKVEHNYNRYNGYFFGCLQLNLSPINIEEEEKDDFDDYLIRKDLPF